jgi:hypothetical protein|tara:strand:+ start:2597 stop:2986 length:390 start_codon:yes stop_codon:yes gene_type:complete
VENTLWFISGYLVCRLITGLLNLVQGFRALKQAEFDCLRILGSTAESMAFLQQTRKQIIDDPAMSSEIKNQFKIQTNMEEFVFDTWKKTSIESLILMYPTAYRRSLKFSDWPSAMTHLTELYKNPSKRT